MAAGEALRLVLYPDQSTTFFGNLFTPALHLQDQLSQAFAIRAILASLFPGQKFLQSLLMRSLRYLIHNQPHGATHRYVSEVENLLIGEIGKCLDIFPDGIEQADSITFDAHKWLSVPMATSMFLTRHKHVLGQTFRIRTDYMPSDENEIQDLGTFGHSIQWSRRFIGLKLYLPSLVFGWNGYEKTILRRIELGKILRRKLISNGWTVYNETDLPVLCFSDADAGEDPEFATSIADKLVHSGEAWVSTYPVGGRSTNRACITNYSTSEDDLDALVKSLNAARNARHTEP